MTTALLHVLTDADIEALRKRNAARLRRAIKQMGRGYAHHPDNRIKRCAAPTATRGPK